MKVRTWFDRALFREHLPEKYQDMSTTKQTRTLNTLDKWGYIEKDGFDKYIFVKDEVEAIE